MRDELLKELKIITPEERQILSGNREIEKNIYMSSETDVIDIYDPMLTLEGLRMIYEKYKEAEK